MFKHSIALAAAFLAAGVVHAQEINPFSRTFMSGDQFAAASQQALGGPAANVAAQQLAQANTIASLPKLPIPVSPSSSTPTAPKAPSTTVEPTPAQAATPVAPAAPVATVAAPVQPKYFSAPMPNEGSSDYYAASGSKKDGYFGSRYLTTPAAPRATATNPQQMANLAPSVAQLRERGEDEGKISIELNRLTPAQFIHWTEATSR